MKMIILLISLLVMPCLVMGANVTTMYCSQPSFNCTNLSIGYSCPASNYTCYFYTSNVTDEAINSINSINSTLLNVNASLSQNATFVSDYRQDLVDLTNCRNSVAIFAAENANLTVAQANLLTCNATLTSCNLNTNSLGSQISAMTIAQQKSEEDSKYYMVGAFIAGIAVCYFYYRKTNPEKVISKTVPYGSSYGRSA